MEEFMHVGSKRPCIDQSFTTLKLLLKSFYRPITQRSKKIIKKLKVTKKKRVLIVDLEIFMIIKQ